MQIISFRLLCLKKHEVVEGKSRKVCCTCCQDYSRAVHYSCENVLKRPDVLSPKLFKELYTIFFQMSNFWHEPLWLPRNVTWDELPPKFHDLIVPIYLAIPLVIIRYDLCCAQKKKKLVGTESGHDVFVL